MVLKIGQHELRGASVKLEKPLAVLKKVIRAQNSSFRMESSYEYSEYHDNDTNPSYEIVGVVRHKFLFKDRPKVLLDPVSK